MLWCGVKGWVLICDMYIKHGCGTKHVFKNIHTCCILIHIHTHTHAVPVCCVLPYLHKQTDAAAGGTQPHYLHCSDCAAAAPPT